MAKKWSEVEQSQSYKDLSGEEKSKLKQRYFDNVVSKSASFNGLPPQEKQAAHSLFFGQTNGSLNDVSLNNLQDIPSTTPKRQYDASEVLPAAYKNGPASILDFANKVGYAVNPQHWREDMDKLGGIIGGIPNAFSNLAGGMTLNALTPDVRKMVVDQNPEVLGGQIATANALAKEYKDRYVSDPGEPWFSALKRTIAEKPVSAASDLATALTGTGGVGKALLSKTLGPLAGPVANYMTKPLAFAGDLVNPLSTTNIPGRIVRGVASSIGTPIPTRDEMIRKVASFARPQNATLMDATEGQAKPMLNALRSPAELVPGSKPNAAQALAGAPGVDGTKIAALQAAADARFPTEAGRVSAAQLAAQSAHLGKIASDPVELKAAFGTVPADRAAATAIHDSKAASEYGAAKSTIVDGDQNLQNLFDSPSMDKVFDVARGIASEEQRPFQIGSNIPAQPAKPAIVNSLFPHLSTPAEAAKPAQWAKYTGEDLDRVKRAFDRLAYDKVLRAKYSIDDDMAQAIIGTRNKYINWMEQPDKNPAYKTAREQYHLRSGMLDRMKGKEYLQDKLSQGPAAYLNALDKFDEYSPNVNVKKATGSQRYNGFEDIFKPNEMGFTGDVKSDIARVNQASQQGKDAAAYSGDLASSATDNRLPGAFGTSNPMLNAFARTLTGKADETIANRLGGALQNPADAADALKQAIRWDRNVGLTQKAAKFVSDKATQYPAIYETLGSHDTPAQSVNAMASPGVAPMMPADAPVDQAPITETEADPSIQESIDPQLQTMVDPGPTAAPSTSLNAFAPDNQDNVAARMRLAMTPQAPLAPDAPAPSNLNALAPGAMGPGQQQSGPAAPRPTTTIAPALGHSVQLDPHSANNHWHNEIAHAFAVTGVPVQILDAVMRQESGGNDKARSPVGAIGLMQLMPDTARGLGIDPHDPAQNVLGGAMYLKQMYDKFGDWRSAIAAYNAGPGALRPSRQNASYQVWEAPYNGGYAETRNYVKTIEADIARRYGKQ